MKCLKAAAVLVVFSVFASCGLPPKPGAAAASEPTAEQLKAILLTPQGVTPNLASATVKLGPSNDPACIDGTINHCGCLGNLSFKISNGAVVEGACCFAKGSLNGEAKTNYVSYFSCKETEVCGQTKDGIICKPR